MGPTHHLFPNVSCTELRSSEGKSTMSIDRNLSLVVEKKIFFSTTKLKFLSMLIVDLPSLLRSSVQLTFGKR